MKNLIAEMARYGITRLDLQKVLGCSERTITNKLNGGTDFTIPEAFKIRDTYFKEFRIEYLFAADKPISA